MKQTEEMLKGEEKQIQKQEPESIVQKTENILKGKMPKYFSMNHLNSIIKNKVQNILQYAELFSHKMFPKTQYTLYEKYRHHSLAIISNSDNFIIANGRANNYNIPLINIVIIGDEQQKLIWNKLLDSFEIAQFLNQNFVIFGRIHKKTFQKDKITEQNHEQTKNEGKLSKKSEGVIQFYVDGQIYQQYTIFELLLMKNQNQIQQILEKARNQYYQIKQTKQQQNLKQNQIRQVLEKGQYIAKQQQPPQNNLKVQKANNQEFQVSKQSNYDDVL